jgi:hypothetical protein
LLRDLKIMWKGLALGSALLGMLAASGAALAQQQRDPLGGQFGVMEAALSPADAAKDVSLISGELASLPPQRPGVVDTYVLVASFWNDPVFENEAKEAAAIIGRRYDATERTVILSAGRGANMPRTYAISTPNNFNAALGRIGQIIDPKEDLVLVFFTSHGAPDGSVAIQEKGRMAGALRAANLRDALDLAGISNRLVIVSACFSGHFILPFSDANSVVLTAAAADKTSFGCEPSRDWTFFGDALFNHAMRSGAGLLPAFEEAKGTITKWEGDVHAAWQAMPAAQRARQPEPQPSNPQSNAGDTALAVITKAEAYGRAAACAGNLSFALDRAKTGRGLKGATDPGTINAALTAAQGRANAEGAPRGRSQQDTAKAIAAVSATVLQAYNTQQVSDVTAHVVACMAAP